MLLLLHCLRPIAFSHAVNLITAVFYHSCCLQCGGVYLIAAGCGRSCGDFCVLVRIILSNLTLRQRKYTIK